MKILITGLGYIGYELCNKFLPSLGFDVTVIDNQFYPDRVKNIIDKGIKFYERDIFNCADLLKDVEILIHTSGITSVPQTKEQSNEKIDTKIRKIGTDGTRYLIKNTNKNCKFLFLSTHCVFEGYNNKFNIDECEIPKPLLAYPDSKYQSELDLIANGKNYNILRLGSVYGYNPAIRIKIIGNILAKMTAIDGKIKVFNGEIYKPIIGIKDCADIIYYVATGHYRKNIFHLVTQNIKVKDIGKICKKHSPNLAIENIIDDSSNYGYTLTNTNLPKFHCKQNIDTEIGNMINIWKNKSTTPSLKA
jgi:nucleoside-diphosphate-sugar epimerase